MTTKQDAMEAAARALFVKELGETEDFSKWQTLLTEYRAQATVAVQAYLAAREAEGWKFTRITADD